MQKLWTPKWVSIQIRRQKGRQYSRRNQGNEETGEHVHVAISAEIATALRAVSHKNPQYFFWSGHSKVQAAGSVWRKRIAGVFPLAAPRNSLDFPSDGITNSV
jgi:hypothetical protein